MTMLQKQTGLYFGTRSELIDATSSYLRSNGRKSELTLNCVSQLLKLNKHTTLESDMAYILDRMDSKNNELKDLSDEDLLKKVLPYFKEERGFQQCGVKTQLHCLSCYISMRDAGELTGNTVIDIQKAIGCAVMFVEYELKKDFSKH